MAQVAINLNYEVRVKLTDYGLQLLLNQRNETAIVKLTLEEYKSQKVDREGYAAFQFYELMHRFGSHLYVGCRMPFASDILIETAQPQPL